MKKIEQCNRSRILIVDDEQLILNVFMRIVHHELPTLTLDTAHNGVEALDIFANFHHEMLLLDLHMPVMNGQQAFLKMRDMCRERLWDMPSVAFCTAYNPSKAFRDFAIDNDAHNCLLIKPVSLKQIVSTVREHMTIPSNVPVDR